MGGLAAAAALGAVGLVGAYWSAGSDPGGNGHALAGVLPTGATPSLSIASRTATVSWAQSTVNGSLLGQLTAGGYSVSRYEEDDPGTPIPAGGTCSGVLSGASDPVTCTESGLPTGRWTYTVTPLLHSWTGGESAPSASGTIAPDVPVSVTLTNGGGAGGAFINTTNQSSLTFAVVLLATSLASDTVTLTLTDGSQTVTQTAAGIDGGGTLTFTSVDASALANGAITISASAASSYGDTSSPRTLTRTKDTIGPALVSLSMRDNNANGKVDRVLATFSEALAAYSAGTAPWTLANVPSGGSLSSVSVSGTLATLTIAEGAGAPDTAVGSFTLALASAATGIRDAAGNLSAFAATSPADGARPVLVSGISDGKENGAEAPGGAPETQPEAKQDATAGLSEPSLSTPAPPVKAKTKGVADIVFMVDSSGSMAPCIDALRTNIEAFIDSLSKGEANNAPPIRDWRGKVVGYRDVEAAQSEGIPWIVDAPFVRDTNELKAQLAALKAEGGGDEPESLLDALFKACFDGSQSQRIPNGRSEQVAVSKRCSTCDHRLHGCVVQGDNEHSGGEGRLLARCRKCHHGQPDHSEFVRPQFRRLRPAQSDRQIGVGSRRV